METLRPRLTVEVKDIYGRLCAYPMDAFLTDLLTLKDTISKTGIRTPAKCFAAGDMPALRRIAAKLDADLVEISNLKGEKALRWETDQITS